MSGSLAGRASAAYWLHAITEALAPSAFSRIAQAVADRPDPGRFNIFLRQVAVATSGVEFDRVGAADREAILEALSSVLSHIQADLESYSGRQALLAEAIPNSIRWHERIKLTARSQLGTLAVGDDLSHHLDVGADVLADLLSTWLRQSLVPSQHHASVALLTDLQRRSIELDETIGIIAAAQGSGASLTAAEAVRDQWRRVKELAPSSLLGRDSELARLDRFVVEEAPALGLVAPERYGKTGLLSTLAVRGVPGVEVVPFHIERRTAGRNDRPTFMHVTGAFFADLAGERYAPRLGLGAEADGHWRALLRKAVKALASRGTTLLLIVDGLDEELAAEAAVPSIAALLPPDLAEYGPHLRIVVSARPNPGMPSDVSTAHWLRQSGVWERLEASSAARTAVDLDEIDDLMSTPIGADVAGLLAAAEGPISAEDIASILNAPLVPVRRLISGAYGRNLIPSSGAGGTTEYRLGHDANLRRIVQNLASLAPEDVDADATREALSIYRDRIRLAVETANHDGWDRAPSYLLSDSYVQSALRSTVERDGLIEALLSSSRLTRIRRNANSESSAAIQLAMCAQHLLGEASPQLTDAAKLLIRSDQLATRRRRLPTRIPAVLALCGDTGAALDLVGTGSENWPEVAGQAIEGFAARGDEEALEQAEHLLDRRLRWVTNVGDVQAVRIARTLSILARSNLEVGRAERAAKHARAALDWLDAAETTRRQRAPELPEVGHASDEVRVLEFEALIRVAAVARAALDDRTARKVENRARSAARGIDSWSLRIGAIYSVAEFLHRRDEDGVPVLSGVGLVPPAGHSPTGREVREATRCLVLNGAHDAARAFTLDLSQRAAVALEDNTYGAIRRRLERTVLALTAVAELDQSGLVDDRIRGARALLMDQLVSCVDAGVRSASEKAVVDYLMDGLGPDLGSCVPSGERETVRVLLDRASDRCQTAGGITSLGFVSLSFGDFERALERFEQAGRMTSRPWLAHAWSALASAPGIDTEIVKSSVAMALAAARRFSSDSDAASMLADLAFDLAQRGHYESAIQVATAAIECSPVGTVAVERRLLDAARCLTHAALGYRDAGDRSRSFELLRDAVSASLPAALATWAYSETLIATLSAVNAALLLVADSFSDGDSARGHQWLEAVVLPALDAIVANVDLERTIIVSRTTAPEFVSLAAVVEADRDGRHLNAAESASVIAGLRGLAGLGEAGVYYGDLCRALAVLPRVLTRDDHPEASAMLTELISGDSATPVEWTISAAALVQIVRLRGDSREPGDSEARIEHIRDLIATRSTAENVRRPGDDAGTIRLIEHWVETGYPAGDLSALCALDIAAAIDIAELVIADCTTRRGQRSAATAGPDTFVHIPIPPPATGINHATLGAS